MGSSRDLTIKSSTGIGIKETGDSSMGWNGDILAIHGTRNTRNYSKLPAGVYQTWPGNPELNRGV